MKFRALLLTAVIVGGFVIVTSRSNSRLAQIFRPIGAASKAWTGPDTAHTAGLGPDESNNIDIYKSARLATVNITSTVYRRNWFMEVYPTKVVGSGFIIDERGRILTNSHVLQGQGKIQVTLPNHEIYEAKILERDPQNDLGLIQIVPKKKLPVLRLSASTPRALFSTPTVFDVSADLPKAGLRPPVVLSRSACTPLAVLNVPVLLLASAPAPLAVL